MTEPLRVVVTGKGGVGKTTVTAALARLLARAGHNVLAVDGDAQCNLARTLGLPAAEAAAIVPLARNTDYTAERAGGGGLVRLNPDVGDVTARFAVAAPDGVRLLVMGGLTQAGGGCLCPENSVLAATVAQVGRAAADVVLLDTQAGVEHFGRALARGFDTALVVADPTANAGQVAMQTARLARDLGIPRVDAVVNRWRTGRPVGWLAEPDVPLDAVHSLPWDDLVLDTEPAVDALLDGGSPFAVAVQQLSESLTALQQEAPA